ncbi:hypothetical protein [Blautia obeum]|uniref:Uncharacterized protein n=1 Tax=Blautia obeum TaxID=40520 RepID=A0A415L1Z2_9FIRM|nr:hypothetical protein [Blautia obeum]RHL42499.1 hypothetical protein DW021_17415 [Blautia obeum]
MSEQRNEIKDIEQDIRRMNANTFFESLKAWADTKNNQYPNETLEQALEILDDIILKEYKEDFVITIGNCETSSQLPTIISCKN